MSESHESPKEAFQRKCSIFISLVASMLLVNNLGSQNSGSSAAFLNASAINTYAFYQAKTIRQNDMNLTANTLDAVVDTSPTVNDAVKQVIRDKAEALRTKAKSYESDPETGEGKKELLAKAKASEVARDTALEKGPYFDFAGLLLQLSIILFSVVLITERRTLYLSASAAAILGTLLSMDGFFLFLKIPLLS
ncbi:MAG: DUF4337 family protein [Burkholderiales bacterium]|nr:DUF4337 family protein [Burkholderiales bacterium]